MYKDRIPLYQALAASRNSKVICYATGSRPGMEAQIGHDAIEQIGNLIDNYQDADLISLYIYTNGGQTLAGWGLVNLLREFCDKLEVIIPSRCLSCGTLISLGADNIVMTKQATLGPIDPSTNMPLNPQIPGRPVGNHIPLSVEDVAGFLYMAEKEGGIKSQKYMTEVFKKLADHVHPIALGSVMRARGQIQDLARKLLLLHMDDKTKIDKIVDILCTDSGSHDYMIYRKEARHTLGLNIETPSMELYIIIRKIYEDIVSEMKLNTAYQPATGTAVSAIVSEKISRVFVESQENGAFHFITTIDSLTVQDPNTNQIVPKVVKQLDAWEPVK